MNRLAILSSTITLCMTMCVAVNAREILPIEGLYYGTNYTVPFAHAYRALNVLGVDHRQAIDHDVYHMSRLGFNAFRVHLWDVELSDSVGNLIENEHLGLMDYLIAQLEKRNIKIMITAQTNFGNGYPERNTDLYGAYTYRYDKCKVHEDPAAIAAQKNYIEQLVRHVNPYNGLSYAQDPDIIAMEINNEPCHESSTKQVTQYIDTMAKAMRQAGWNKTVLYNVSHNIELARGYYDADIDGTTYQWYPLGLVSGRIRTANFLPYVDQYDIPFKNMPNYDKLSRVVYEFDPADNLLSYVIPAAARTFREQGFKWATQFAYDPTDMAWANTEYQTHYLNLAYTPSKALGMMVAGEVMRQVPDGADYGSFPVDTIFGPFTLSAQQDLAVLNDGKHYYHTNPTTIAPKSASSLNAIAGKGSSPIVKYDGSGAFFIDKISDGVWRVEVMPDILMTKDPFAKPSLNRSVGEIVYQNRPFTANLPGLDAGFAVRSVTNGSTSNAKGKTFTTSPGVYLIGNDANTLSAIDIQATYGDGTKRINEFVAPAPTKQPLVFAHTASALHSAPAPLQLDVTTIGKQPVDSVTLYSSTVSFWNNHNDIRRFKDLDYGHYQLVIDNPQTLGWGKPSEIKYWITIWQGGKATTYPDDVNGTPLDWDYDEKNSELYTTQLYYPGGYLRLLSPQPDLDGSEISMLPTQWEGTHYKFVEGARVADNCLTASMDAPKQETKLIVLKSVANLSGGLTAVPEDATICIELDEIDGVDEMELSFTTTEGISFNAPVSTKGGIVRLKASDFVVSPTILCPEPYPVFMNRIFIPDVSIEGTDLQLSAIEDLQIIATVPAGSSASFSVVGLWLE